MEVSGEIHNPDALHTGKETLVPILRIITVMYLPRESQLGHLDSISYNTLTHCRYMSTVSAFLNKMDSMFIYSVQ